MTHIAEPSASDVPPGTWIDRLAPAGIRPYLRLARIDRPIGTWLLLFPCWWSIALASPGQPEGRLGVLFALFAVGALVMRGAGCTLNDIVDRDFDGRVARTAGRPIPSGAISVGQAMGFGVLLLVVGFAILVQFNAFAIMVGAVSLVLVAAYPFAKRLTYWPQAVLGLTFNWGALLGWAAVRGDLGWPAVALYAAGVFWTLGYDTIYAHQDKEDDALIGIKSTALRLGDSTRPWLFGFYGTATALMALAGALADLAWPYYGFLAVGAAHLTWQATMVEIDDAGDCLAKFRSNRHFGWIVLAGIVVGQAY